ncbi:hypothetical protein [Prevotella sp. HUN102]|uniref:hypothetical protein n=1 Tax=Prevotella sp. HUN102 TaxID=1392486 RepID=UPI00048BF8D3|nr:hypothetical protein [Prevotella sp. HUN102]
MEQTMVYELRSPKGIRIKHIQETDIIPVSDGFRKEGCPIFENRFLPEDLCIDLDAIQKRAAQRNHTAPRASADFLFCVDKCRVLFADAKFKCEKVKNIDKKEIADKKNESRSLINDDEYYVLNDFYLLFKKSVLNNQAKGYLKRMFKGSPKFHFLNGMEFSELFGR